MLHYQQMIQTYEAHRPAYHTEAYDSKWYAIRKVYLSRHPECSVCGGIATEVHHIVSIKDDLTLRLEWSNLMPLCKAHHSQITTKENGAGWKGNKSFSR